MAGNVTDAYIPKPYFADVEDFWLETPNSYIMTVMSAFSAAASISILVAFAFFKSSARGLMRIIVYIAVSNLMASLGSIVGMPMDRSFACWWEGIVTNIFALSSIYWCLDVTVILYQIVVHSTARSIGIVDHVVCWGVPVLVTFLPFTTRFTYGAPGGEGWCFTVPVDDYHYSTDLSIMWFWVAYYVHVWFCALVMTYCFSRIWWVIQTHASLTQKMLIKIYKKLEYYPVVIVVCWLPACIVDTTSLVLPDFEGYAPVNGIATFLACSQGLLTAFVFWSTYDEAVHKAKQFYHKHRATIAGEKYEEVDFHDETGSSNSTQRRVSNMTSEDAEVSVSVNVSVNVKKGSHGHSRSVFENRSNFAPEAEASVEPPRRRTMFSSFFGSGARSSGQSPSPSPSPVKVLTVDSEEAVGVGLGVTDTNTQSSDIRTVSAEQQSSLQASE